MTAVTADSLRDLVAKWRAAGLEVVVDDGWEHRERPGSFAPGGNLHHHVGSNGNGLGTAQWMFRDGRPDLPAPLCQTSTDRQGRLYLGAAGRANHAGVARAFGTMPSGDGNAMWFGWEHQNNGFEGWPKVQYEAMVLAAAIACLHFGWPAGNNPAHRETSVTGKWDPGALDMLRFREDIAAAMRNERAPKMTHVQTARIALGQAISALHVVTDELDQAPNRKFAFAQRAAIVTARRGLINIHRRLSKK